MNTIRWNNLIAGHLFNEKNAEKDVFVCMAKNDIIMLGKSTSEFSNTLDETIWEDFCNSINYNDKGFIKNFNDQITQYENTINYNRENNLSPPEYPFFISHLIFLTLPLITEASRNYSTANYYGKLMDFLDDTRKGRICYDKNLGTVEWIKSGVDRCWKILEEWTKDKNIGNFKINDSIEKLHSKYVTKIFSQVILQPKHRETLLPKAFRYKGEPPSDINRLKTYLTDNGVDLKITEHDHWKIATQLVKNEWDKWTQNPQNIQNIRRITQKNIIPKNDNSKDSEPLQNPIRIKWKIKGDDIYYFASCNAKLSQTFIEKYDLQNEYVIDFCTENKHLAKYVNKKRISKPKDIKWNSEEYIHLQTKGKNIPTSGTGSPNLEFPFLCIKENDCYLILLGKNFYDEAILATTENWQITYKEQTNPPKEIDRKKLCGKELIFYEISGEYKLESEGRTLSFGSTSENLTEKNADFCTNTIEWVAKSKVPIFSEIPNFIVIENDNNIVCEVQTNDIHWRYEKENEWKKLNDKKPEDGLVNFAVNLGNKNYSYLNCFLYKGDDCRPETKDMSFIDICLKSKNNSIWVKAFTKFVGAFFRDSDYKNINHIEIEDKGYEYKAVAIGDTFTVIISKENCNFNIKYTLEKNKEIPLYEILDKCEMLFNRFPNEKFKISIEGTDSEIYYISPQKAILIFRSAQELTEDFFKKKSEADEIEDPFEYMYVPVEVWKEKVRICNSNSCFNKEGMRICDSQPTRVEVLFEDFKNLIKDIYDKDLQNIITSAFLRKDLSILKPEKPNLELIKVELKNELKINGFQIDNYFEEDFIKINREFEEFQIIKNDFFYFPLAAALIITGHMEYNLSIIEKISFNQNTVPKWFLKMLKYYLYEIITKKRTKLIGLQRNCEIINEIKQGKQGD
jgi:hypothetical protein